MHTGKKIAILAGRGALGAADELEQVAEKLGAPIVKALLGKAVVPDDSPYTTSQLGILGTRPSQEVLEECDALLMVGTSFPYIEYPSRGKPGRCRLSSTRCALACVTRSKWDWSVTVGGV